MLALIGNFKFDVNDTHYDKLKSVIDFGFKTSQRLGNFDSHQDTGKYEESLEITGNLVAKSQKQLLAFETMAKLKLPVTFVTDDFIQTILIFKIEKERSIFLKGGEFIKQTYKIYIQVVGDGFRTK